MKVLPLADLIISPDRQRKEFTPQKLEELKTSILSKGLLHAIVVSISGDQHTLVAGERRIRVLSELHAEGETIFHDGQPIPAGTVPFASIGDLSPALVAEAELEENLVRANLTWQEEQEAIALIHKLRTSQNPEQTKAQTAQEIATISGKSPETERKKVEQALIVAANLHNPRVRAAKSATEAYRAILDDVSTKTRAQLAKLTTIKTEHQVLLGDCREVMKTLPEGTFDIILTDPPYGMNADKMKKTEKHFYDDSPENALEITKAIISQGWKLCKPKAVAFIFCDIDHFVVLREFAKAQLWTPWRTPLIWKKGEEGFAPWGQLGFSRTYEICLFLSKGERGLKGGGSDIKEFARPKRNERTHAAEKPVDLLRHLLTLAGDRGDNVLDPCCGSGPVLEAATLEAMKTTAIELDPDYHSLALARLVKDLEPALDSSEEELLA